MVLKKYTAMLAMLTCCSLWGAGYVIEQHESVEYSVLVEKSKFDLISLVGRLDNKLSKVETILQNLRLDLDRGFQDMQEEIERSSSVSGFFSSMWRSLVGINNPLSTQINRLRSLLNR